MCKRFYVEVTGLGEDGEQRLMQAGVARDAILVVEEDRKHPALARAIREVTGLPMAEVLSRKSDRLHVMARVIYVYYAYKDGESIDCIAKDIGKQARYTGLYLDEYENKLFGDVNFQRVNAQVAAHLEADPEWSPKKPQKVRPEKRRKTRKRRRKPRKRRKVTTHEDIEEKMEKRQLKINFEDYASKQEDKGHDS